MLGNRKLILDTFCEVYDLLKPWSDGEFYDLNDHTLVPNAIYLIGRTEFRAHQHEIRQWVNSDKIKVILSNPAEGSETLKWHCKDVHHCADLIKSGQMLLIGGGDMHPEWNCLQYDSFLPKILDYDENLVEIQHAQDIFHQTQKPYKFLFLNGRLRSHRKYLIEYLDSQDLLDQGLWTWLDKTPPQLTRFSLSQDGQNLLLRPRAVHYLPSEYEVPRFRNKLDQFLQAAITYDTSLQDFTKLDLFNREWGEIYLYAPSYVDTYFSIVTETVFHYPYSFRTEKIWKPIAMGHPWICAANYGFYKDMKNLGFQTFSSIIDERFDNILNDQDRVRRIAEVIKDLCGSDLPAFLKAAEPMCKYNQQHLAEMRLKVRNEFPERFFQYLRQYQWMT